MDHTCCGGTDPRPLAEGCVAGVGSAELVLGVGVSTDLIFCARFSNTSITNKYLIPMGSSKWGLFLREGLFM